jgi:hypothetical protein
MADSLPESGSSLTPITSCILEKPRIALAAQQTAEGLDIFSHEPQQD